MKIISFSVAILLFILVIKMVAAQFPGTYDPKDKVFASLGLEPRSSPPTSISESLDGYYFSTFEYVDRSSGWLPFPLALAPIAVAYNATPILPSPNEATDIEISLFTLGSWMMGTLQDDVWNKTLTPPTSKNIPIGISQLKLVIAPDSKTTRAVLYRLYEHGVPGFESSAYTLPAAVLSNPNITFVSSDDHVVAALNSTTTEAVMGFVAVTSGELFDTAFVSVTDDRGDVALLPSSLSSADPERFQMAVDPTIPNSAVPNVSSRVDFNFTWAHRKHDPVYPLVFTVFSNQPYLTNCSDPKSSGRGAQAIVSILNYYTKTQYENHNTKWSMLALPIAMRSLLVADSIDLQPCVPATPMSIGGSTVLAGLFNKYSILYVQKTSQTSRYLPLGNAFGSAYAFTRQFSIGATESPLTQAQQQANPEFVQFPVSAWGISFPINVPGFDTIFLDKCDLLSVMNKSIDTWDHPRIQRMNPAAKLPNEKIQIVVPYLHSGAIQLILAGMKEIDTECRRAEGKGPSEIVVSTLWNLYFDRSHSTGTATLVDVKNSKYSLTVAAKTGYISDPDMKELMLVNTTDGSISGCDAEGIGNTLNAAHISDPVTGEIDLTGTSLATSGWPFVGLSYLVTQLSNKEIIDTKTATGIYRAARMAYWVLTDAEARSTAIEAGYTPLPDFIAQNALQKIAQAKVNGYFVFPELQVNTTDTSFDTTAIIGGGVGGFVFLMIIFAVVSTYLASRGKKSDKHAVKDGHTPMALIFTDIQSSTTLWSVAPQAMAASLDLHNEIIDKNIEKYDAYKIKTIGDAYMICVKDIKNAHEMCLSIQRDLHYAEWPSDEIDLAYADLFQSDESPYQIYNPDGTEMSYKQRKKLRGYETELYKNRTNPALYHGIAIRIGLTYGVAEPKLDEVTGAYDYHGPNVNLASRCESCGNGGQTVYSVYAIEALRDADVDLTDAEQLAVASLGKQPLKGIPAPIELYQVLPAELGARQFPPLRLDKDSAMTMELESETENTGTNNTTATTNTAFSSTVGSNKASDTGSKMSDPSHNTSNASSAPTDESSEDEYEKRFCPDYRFARYLSKSSRTDARLLLFAYDVTRSAFAATPSEKTRRTVLDNLCKDWRVQDFRTKQHLFFKKELGYEEYWTLRLAAKFYGQLSTKQRKRPGAAEHDTNIMRRGMLKGDDFGASSASTTDGTTGTAGTFADAIKVSSINGAHHGSAHSGTGGSSHNGSAIAHVPLLHNQQQLSAPSAYYVNHSPGSKHSSSRSTDGGDSNNNNNNNASKYRSTEGGAVHVRSVHSESSQVSGDAATNNNNIFQHSNNAYQHPHAPPGQQEVGNV